MSLEFLLRKQKFVYFFFFFFFAWNKIIRRLAKFILVSLRNLLELCKASY